LTIADASKGYWQTAIRPEDQWKTGFICDDQLYEWTRTAFVMKSSGQTFCRAVQQVLESVRDIVGTFVDDMVVHSYEFLKHLEDLGRFLTVIRNSGMTLKVRKCKFALPQVKFCGQIIGSGMRQPDPEKVAAVHAIKVPTTQREVGKLWDSLITFEIVFHILLLWLNQSLILRLVTRGIMYNPLGNLNSGRKPGERSSLQAT